MGRSFICSCLPHGDGMCLLEDIAYWDETMIECRTRSMPVASHPLRRSGGLHAVVATEYAAQATAVHGALRQPEGHTREGRIAGVRDLAWHVSDLAGYTPLRVRCHEQMRQQQAIVYDFELAASEAPLVTGQVTIAFPEERS